MRSICVFCAASAGTDPVYMRCARELGAALAGAGMELLYGGGKLGMMGAVADGALAGGGRVVGVIPHFLCGLEQDHAGLTELHHVETMHERKAMLASRADAFVALPGGFGTFDELCEIVTWRQLKLHDKPIVLVNVDGYYDGLLMQLRRGIETGLVRAATVAGITVVSDVAGAMAALKTALSGEASSEVSDLRVV